MRPPVVQYLAALGDADTPTPTQPLEPAIAMRSWASTSTDRARATTSPSTCSRIVSADQIVTNAPAPVAS